jgi:hypothetical protein
MKSGEGCIKSDGSSSGDSLRTPDKLSIVYETCDTYTSCLIIILEMKVHVCVYVSIYIVVSF